VLAFRNNVLHRGGFPLPGHERKVCVFHLYPAAQAVPFAAYLERGLGKTASYPVNPAW
jgi:hypothetical protein